MSSLTCFTCLFSSIYRPPAVRRFDTIIADGMLRKLSICWFFPCAGSAEVRPFRARVGAAKADGLRLRRGQNPLSLFPWKKRKRLLMVSREKGWAAAFRASPGTLAAPVTGVLAWWKLTGLDHSTAYGSFGSWGVVPDAPCFCFAAAIRWLRGICNMGGNASANVRVRQRKENGGASGRDPEFCRCQERIQRARPTTTAGPKPP